LIYITGRKKDIIITSGGKNITPSNIELAIKAHPLASNASHTSLLTWHKKQTADLNAIQVSEAVVIGDKRPYLVALITLEPDVAALKAKDMVSGCASKPTNQPASQPASQPKNLTWFDDGRALRSLSLLPTRPFVQP